MKKVVFCIIIILILASCVTSKRGRNLKQSKDFYWSVEVGDNLSWTIELPVTQEYIFSFKVINSNDFESHFNVYTDQGHSYRVSVPTGSGIYTHWIDKQLMMSGPITISIEDLDNGLELLSVDLSNKYILSDKSIDTVPVNENASNEVKDLMIFLGNNSGKGILSGQMDLTWDDSVDMELRVARFTGQKPAIMGFDFMNYINNNDGGSGLKQIEEAIAYANKGGLITFCWHWRVGSSNEFYTKNTDFRINRDVESAEYKEILSDIDNIALKLKKLSDSHIPVLWRPLHEASGGWFWWGATGPEDYLFLWNLIYDRLTNYHELNNLIWVWNGQDKLWYPGDDKVDVIGVDVYKGRMDNSSLVAEYARAQTYVEGDKLKLIALTENASIPNPEELLEDHVPWAWFMTWNDNNSNAPDDFFSGEYWTTHRDKKLFFNHPYFLNLEDLKDYNKN